MCLKLASSQLLCPYVVPKVQGHLWHELASNQEPLPMCLKLPSSQLLLPIKMVGIQPGALSLCCSQGVSTPMAQGGIQPGAFIYVFVCLEPKC